MTEPQDKRTEQVDLRRRRLGQAALGGTAVLATLSPGSVRAYYCMTGSAVVSLNVSQDNRIYSCSGRSPGMWKERWDKWADDGSIIGPKGENYGNPWPTAGGGDGYHGDQAFQDVFGDPPLGVVVAGKTASEVTLYEAIEASISNGGSGGGTDRLSGYFVASLLNAAASLIPEDVFTEATLKQLYRDVYASGGFYTPYPGIDWTPEDVKAYLATTWGEGSIDSLRTLA